MSTATDVTRRIRTGSVTYTLTYRTKDQRVRIFAMGYDLGHIDPLALKQAVSRDEFLKSMLRRTVLR